MSNKVIGYIYNNDGKYSYQIWFAKTVDNIADFLYQTRNAPKVLITNTRDNTIVEYANTDKIYLSFHDDFKGLGEAFKKRCVFNNSKEIDGLLISHDQYDTPYLKAYLNNMFHVDIL